MRLSGNKISPKNNTFCLPLPPDQEMMKNLNFPPVALQIESTGEPHMVFDRVRRRFVALTPEEWVRQHLVHYLIDHRGYRSSLITVEGSLRINRMNKRVDVVCWLAPEKPWLVAECKAPTVVLSQAVLDQVLRYNTALGSRYVLITNGLVHVCVEMPTNGSPARVVQEIPLAPVLPMDA